MQTNGRSSSQKARPGDASQVSTDRWRQARALLERFEDASSVQPSLNTAGTSRALASPADLALAPALHEWFTSPGSDAVPPLGVLIALAHETLARHAAALVAWIGRRSWPHPLALARRGSEPDRQLLERSLFIDAPSRAERVWAIEQAARCPSVALVVGDGAGFAVPESRRLQLAASAPVQLIRPPAERRLLSAARTRWHVEPTRFETDTADQGWSVRLLRCKGIRPEHQGAHHWVVRRHHATAQITTIDTTRDGHRAAQLVHRPAPTARPA